jgi:hypothetical protein
VVGIDIFAVRLTSRIGLRVCPLERKYRGSILISSSIISFLYPYGYDVYEIYQITLSRRLL